MPSYNYTNPQGQSFTLDVDEELQPDQVYQRFVDAGVAQAQAPQATTNAGYLSQLGSALSIGAGQMASGVKATFNAATGDIPDTAAAMAQMGALQKEQQANLSAEEIALNEAFARNKAEYDQARGILPTIGALSGYVGSIASQPRAAFKQAIQSAPNAIIGAGTGLAGYALGGLVGAGAGIETGPGAVLTGIAGAAAGGAISNSLMEAGPAIYDILNERTNGAASSMTADQITQVLQQNPDIMSEGLKTGAIRGSVIGVIEGLGMKGAGRLMSIPERAAARAVQKTLIGAGVDVASKEAVESALLDPALKNAVSAAAKTAQNEFTSAGNLARLAGASGIEIGASGAGEVGAQVATGQEIDPTAAVQEMMGEVGLSIPVAAVAKGLELARTPQALQTPIQQALAREINAIPTNAVPPQTEEEKRAGVEAGNPIIVDPQGNTAAVAPEMWNEAIKRQITPPVEAQTATQPSDVEARLANLMRNPGLTAAVNTADSIVTTAENTSSDVSQATTAARNIIQGVVDTPQPREAPAELPAVTPSPAMEQTEKTSQTITDSNGEIAPEMSVLPPTVQAGAGVGEAIQLQPIETAPDAIQEQITDEGLLRQKRPEMELQGLGEGNAQPQEVATEGQIQEEVAQPITPQGTPTLATEGKVMPRGSATPPSRGRPVERVVFEKPIKTPIGEIVSYDWQYKVEEVPDKEGEMGLRRFSDWDQAEKNADTGRDIVHQFTVRKPDGTTQLVSLESALGKIPVTAAKGFKAAIKAARRLPVYEAELARLELQQKNRIEAENKARKEGWKNSPPIELRDSGFPSVMAAGARMAWIGDNEVALVDKRDISEDGTRINSAIKSQEIKTEWAMGQIKTPSLSYGEQTRIDNLRRSIKRDKATLKENEITQTQSSSESAQGPQVVRGVSPSNLGENDTAQESPQTTTVAAPTETAAPSAKEAAVASVVQQPVEGSIPTVEQESAITAIESTEKTDVAKEAMRFLEADLTDTQRAKWTPEMFTAAQAFFDSGGKDFDSLKKAIKFPRVVQQAYLKADKEAAAEQTRREAADAAMAREVEKAEKEQAKLEADQKQREELGLKTLNSLIEKTRTNVVQGTVKSSDANQAVAILNKSGAIPNVLFTWIGTSKDFLADPANRARYPETWKAVSSNQNIEGMSENGQPIVFTDNVGVSDLDRNLAKLQGTTPEVAAVRRVILHENIHKGMFFLSLKDKMKLFQFLHRLYSPEELDQLAKSYDEYSDWRTNQVSYFSIIEEAMTRDFDSMAEIPRDGIWAEFMQFLRDIWQKITGKTSEPTLKNYKDVFRLIRNSLKNSEKANADRLKNGGGVRMSMSEFISNVTPEQDAAYAKAVADGDMETAQRMVDEAAKNAGYNVGPVWHGTKKWPFNSFKLPEIDDGTVDSLSYRFTLEDRTNAILSGADIIPADTAPLGLWFTARKGIAEGFAGVVDKAIADAFRAAGLPYGESKVVSAFLKLKRPKVYPTLQELLDDLAIFKNPLLLRKQLAESGHDGIVISESITDADYVGGDLTPRKDFVAFNSNQIKSADPVTRDEAGNVIPLSRRFQTASNDIRFSKVEYDSPNEEFKIPSASKLSDLSSLPFSYTQSEIVSSILSLGFNPSIRVVNEPTFSRAAVYNGSDGIILNFALLDGKPKYALRAIVHESVHDATHAAIRRPENKEIVDRLNDLMAYAKRKFYSNKSKYGGETSAIFHSFENLDEFVTGAFTEKSFRSLLSKLELSERSKLKPSSEEVSVFRKFMELVMELLNMSGNPSILEEVVKSGEALMMSQTSADFPLSRDNRIENIYQPGLVFRGAKASKVTYESPNEAAFNSGAEVARNADYDERDKAVRSTIRAAYDLAPKDNGPSVPLDQLFDIAKQSMPDLTENEFSQILQDLYEDSGALLQAGESPFSIFNNEGERAGSVIVMPPSGFQTRAMASIVDSPATNEFTQSVDGINNGTAKAAFSGRQFKDFKPIDRTVKSAEEYSDVAIKYVNNLEKEGVSLEDIANSVISPVFLESIGIEQDLMAQDALTIEVRQRVDNASRKEKSPGRKKQLSKLSERLSAFWQGVGSKKGQHLGQRRYLVNKARYSWMFIRELAEKAMKEARTNILISNFGSENATSFTQNSYADSDKANQQSVDENINAAEEAQEFDQDAADLAAGEATLTGAFLKLYEELKDLIRQNGLIAKARDSRVANAAKASISDTERNAIMSMSDAELNALESKNNKRIGEILNTLLGKEADANTPEKKTVRKKREKMVEVVKKRLEQGKPIDFSKQIDSLFTTENPQRDEIIDDIANSLLQVAKNRGIKPSQKTALADLVASIKSLLKANIKGEDLKADEAPLGQLLARTYLDNLTATEAKLFAQSWNRGRDKVRKMLAETGLEGATLEAELSAIMPATPTIAYNPSAVRKAITRALREATLDANDLLANPRETKAEILKVWDKAAVDAGFSPENWQEGRKLAEKSIDEFIIERKAAKERSKQIAIAVVEQSKNPASLADFSNSLAQFKIKPDKVRELFDQAKLLAKRRVQIANDKAIRVLFEAENKLAQSAFFNSSTKPDTIVKAFREQISDPMDRKAFKDRLMAMEVTSEMADRLFDKAAREKDNAQWKRAQDMLEGPNALRNILREINRARPGDQAPLSKQIPWRELLSQKASTVEEYRQRIFDAISANEELKSATPDQKARLADLFAEAWEANRTRILDGMLERMIRAEEAKKNLSKEGAKALQAQRMRIVEDINLGIFDNDELAKRMAEKFGIKSEFTETEREKINSLIEVLQDEGLNAVKRQVAAYKLLEVLQGELKIPVAKMLADFWVSSVLSGPNTIVSIGLAVASGAFELSTALSRVFIAGFTNPKQLPSELAGAYKTLARLLSAYGRQANIAWQYLVSGDPVFLDPSMNDVTENMQWGNIGKSNKLAEQMAKSDKILVKSAGLFMRTVSRLLTALDVFNSGLTKEGSLSIVFRQIGLDPAKIAEMEKKSDLMSYKDTIIQKDFGGTPPKSARDKAILDSYALADMMKELDKLGNVSENANFFGQQGAMTLDPSGLGGVGYRAIRSLVTNAEASADRFLKQAQRGWNDSAQNGDRILSGLELAFAYFMQFATYNAANFGGVRFARFAGNKFNQGLSFIPGIGFARAFEAEFDPNRISGKEAFIDSIRRNQLIGVMLSVAGYQILKAIADEPDDEKRGWFINGGWGNLTPEKKQQKLAAGEKEYTIGINGKVFNYANWPISSVLAAIGSLSDLIRFSPDQWNDKNVAQIMASAAMSGAAAAADIPALSQFQELFGNSLSSKDPNEKRMERFAKVMSSYAGGFVPRFLKDIDYAQDPNLRKYETLWEKTASHIPVYRRYEGKEYYDILGQQIQRNVYPGSREFMVKPTDPAYKVLGALNSRGIWLTPANAEHRMVGKGARRRSLTQEEADNYSLETGKGYKQMLLRYGQRALQMPTERARAFLLDKADEVRDRALKKVYRGYQPAT